MAIRPLPGLGYGGLAGVDSLLSPSSSVGCNPERTWDCVDAIGVDEMCGNCGAVSDPVADVGEVEELKNIEEDTETSSGILRIKLIEAIWFASARFSEPDAAVVEGVNC